MKVKVIVPVKKSQPRNGAFQAKTCENHPPGSIIEISDKEAAELIELGIVESVEQEINEKPITEKPIEKSKPGRKKIDDVRK